MVAAKLRKYDSIEEIRLEKDEKGDQVKEAEENIELNIAICF